MPCDHPATTAFLQTPKPLRHARGGASYAWLANAARCEMAEFLRDHTRHDHDGAVFLTALPKPHHAFVFEGHAPSGVRFGCMIWRRGNVCVWTLEGWRRRLSPAILTLKDSVVHRRQNLGIVPLPDGRTIVPGLCHQSYHSRITTDQTLPSGASFFPLFAQGATAHPFAAPASAVLIQALCDRAHADVRGPKVARPYAAALEKGWVHPAWHQNGNGFDRDARTERVLDVARPYLANLALDPAYRDGAFTIHIEAPMRKGDGTFATPDMRCVLHMHDDSPLVKSRGMHILSDLNNILTHAWSAGTMGPHLSWYTWDRGSPINTTIRRDLSDLFPSRHAAFEVLHQGALDSRP